MAADFGITDNVLNSMVNGIDGVIGGTTTFDSMLAFMITGGNSLPKYENDPVAVTTMREACHHNLYAIAFSALFVVSLVMWILNMY